MPYLKQHILLICYFTKYVAVEMYEHKLDYKVSFFLSTRPKDQLNLQFKSPNVYLSDEFSKYYGKLLHLV